MFVNMLLIVVFLDSLFGREMCPVSSTMNLNDNFLYPVDIYATPEALQNISLSVGTFACHSPYLNSVWYEHKCSSTKYCPLDIQNVHDATLRRFAHPSSLCHIKHKLSQSSETIRVIVTGDSVVRGHGTNGCTASDTAQAVYAHVRCAWPYHFGQWLNRTSNASVETYNLAMNGHTSLKSGLGLLDLMKDNNCNVPFTSNDIIFIDFSTGDDTIFDSIDAAEQSLEFLVRKIYSLSVNDSWPSIILIDAGAGNFIAHYPKLYPVAYESIAQYYNIPIWSYREAVHSNYSTTEQKQFVDVINFNNNLVNPNGRRNFHPPWHVHLFMADLYAAIWETRMHHCTEELEQRATSLHTSPLILPPLKSNESFYELDHYFCSHNEEKVLSLSYDELMHNTTLGTFSVNPEGTWQVREDVKDRGGFIVDRSDGRGRMGEIAFHLVNSTKQLLENKIETIHLQMQYLKTYENAGLVFVYVCGELQGQYDALWKNFDTNHISVPEAVNLDLRVNACVRKNFEFPQIEFSHMKSKPHPARGYEKFKIISIKGCV